MQSKKIFCGTVRNPVIQLTAEDEDGCLVSLTVVDFDSFITASKNEIITWENEAGTYVEGTKADLSNFRIVSTSHS